MNYQIYPTFRINHIFYISDELRNPAGPEGM